MTPTFLLQHKEWMKSLSTSLKSMLYTLWAEPLSTLPPEVRMAPVSLSIFFFYLLTSLFTWVGPSLDKPRIPMVPKLGTHSTWLPFPTCPTHRLAMKSSSGRMSRAVAPGTC